MNTGQSLLSIGALLILSLSILRVNNEILLTDSILQESKLGVLATSLATSLMEEANRKAFDEASAYDAVTSLTQLTAPLSLGPETGETSATFNDFDDYNNYTQCDTIHAIDYELSCIVDYITPNNVEGKIMAKSWHKKITIIVKSSFIADSLIYSSVYSYWHFR